ncbi:MAG: class I SAM-dependent methyltransferase [Deltaproteobacteria bacterium]|jgi:hypothetical protein|nr:class I SAM-dependent methyltransferase [Deltaproteobacteria bacterium]
MPYFHSPALDGLGLKHATDKSSGPRGHDFLRKYEFFLKPWQNEAFTLLELGVYMGASLRMWADYFPRAAIIGTDIEPQALDSRTERLQIILGDLSQPDFLESLIPLGASIIIDDASHWWPDQLRSLLVLYPALPGGGLYIIEDIHTSFPPLDKLFQAGFETPPFFLMQKLAEYLTGNLSPAPIVRDQELKPIARSPVFHEELLFLARRTDAVIFLERACLLIKK